MAGGAEEPRAMGGQAVIEGVMMRGPDAWAVSVRQADGTIATRVEPVANWSERYRRVPLVRGVMSLGESLSLGYRALHWSANQQLAAELAAEEAELETLAGDADSAEARAAIQRRIAKNRKQAAKLTEGAVGATMVIALVLFAAIFLVLPALIGKGLHNLVGFVPFQVGEGVVRLTLFLGYVALISLMPEIRRVFQYHGAEHKSIAAYENGVELTPESANQFTTAHVRCGTNFLLTVMVIAIACYSFVPTPNLLWVIGSRVVLIPVIAGISYEVIRNAARHMHRPWVRAAMKPGLLLQRLTTREPTLDQLEVALASLRASMTATQLAEVDARRSASMPRPAFGAA